MLIYQVTKALCFHCVKKDVCVCCAYGISLEGAPRHRLTMVAFELGTQMADPMAEVRYMPYTRWSFSTFWILSLFSVTCVPTPASSQKDGSKLCSGRVRKIHDSWNSGILITCQEPLGMPVASREAVTRAAGSLNAELWCCPPKPTKYSYPSAFSRPPRSLKVVAGGRAG